MSRRALAWTGLIGLVVAQVVTYGVIAMLSRQFGFESGFRQRPIPAIVAAFGVGFTLYVASLVVALRLPETRRLAVTVFVVAILFRAILLATTPIQEIDIYRYVWDGAVTSSGVNPFRYPPAVARDMATSDPTIAEELLTLRRIREQSPAIDEALGRVHFAELTTVYPPVSQLVFASADRVTPDGATLFTRVTVMKAVLLWFDLATVAGVWWLVTRTGRHVGWVIGYAWCPLVIKEFANSGHLDSIAVGLSTGAACFLLRPLVGPSRRPAIGWGAAAILLSLSVGAKLYAVFLFPLFTVVVWRRWGRASGLAFAGLFAVVTALGLGPMFLMQNQPREDDSESRPPIAVKADADANDELAAEPLPPPGDRPDSASVTPLKRAASGLSVFLSRWEMNDFLFLIAYENLRPSDPTGARPRPWFAVLPEPWREAWVDPIAGRLGLDSDRAAFLITRGVTGAIFVGIAAALLLRVARNPEPPVVLESIFLTLAWFWLLAPTGNPWYWTWALPFLPFARSRVWIAMSGLVLLYYLRFWLMYHWHDDTVLGSPYNGTQFFDFVLTWVEFGPWFVWLGVESILAGGRHEITRRAQPAVAA